MPKPMKNHQVLFLAFSAILIAVKPVEATTSNSSGQACEGLFHNGTLRVSPAQLKLDFKNHFRDVYEKRRRELKITQQQLGDLLGVSKSTISHMFAGRSEPSLSQVVMMIKIFGLSVEDAYPASWRLTDRKKHDVKPSDIISITLANRVFNLLRFEDGPAATDRRSDKRIELALEITRSLENDNSITDDELVAAVISHLFKSHF